MKTHAKIDRGSTERRGGSKKSPPTCAVALPSVRRILRAPTLQAKLTVGAPNDAFEQEADRVANHVMRMPEASLQRKCAACAAEDEETLRAKAEPGGQASVPAGFESRFNALHGGGQPLPASERSFFEPRFGRDFSSVRVHHGPAAGELARSVNARAFTLGNSVVFGDGEYAPGSTTGRSLLAHELTHVVQQGAAAKEASSTLPTSSPARVQLAPGNRISRACSPKKISVTNSGKGSLGYPLGSILSASDVRYRYDLRWDVDGKIQDCDLGTKISALMVDESSAKTNYYINAKKSTKADYDSATDAWTANKETFVDDYDKSELIGAAAGSYITESGTTWARVADGPGGPVASWATAALVRYTVIGWIRGSDGKELSLRFWVTLWTERAKSVDPFTVRYLYVSNIPGSVSA